MIPASTGRLISTVARMKTRSKPPKNLVNSIVIDEMNDTPAGSNIFDAVLVQRKLDLLFSAEITMLSKTGAGKKTGEIEKGRIKITVCEEGH